MRFGQTLRRTLWALLLLAIGSACTCDDSSAAVISIRSGVATAESLSPRSALVEYVEVPGKKNELVIHLASDDIPCGQFRPAGADAVRVSVTLILPPNAKPEAKVYLASAPADDAGDAATATPSVISTLRIGSRSRVLPPGGQLELRSVALTPGARVEGILALEFAGTPEVEPASVRGHFSARVCRVDQGSGS